MVWIFWVTLAVMLVGLAGTFMPALPGLPIIWVAALVYAIATGFHALGWLYLVVTGAVVLLVQVAEQLARAWGAKRFGASKWGTWGAVIGSLIGLFFMPLGLILGPFLGAMLGELIAGRSMEDAVRAGWGGLVGVLGSVLINVLVGIGLIISFIWVA
ncbi:MAG TPA: DUF456 family protein [Symbiobacteriaceae bacterium]|nr:DUF456 family protein [Symbiobacteriaceae bacterium]